MSVVSQNMDIHVTNIVDVHCSPEHKCPYERYFGRPLEFLNLGKLEKRYIYFRTFVTIITFSEHFF